MMIEGIIKNKAMRMSASTTRNFDGGKIEGVQSRAFFLFETYFHGQSFFRDPIMLSYFLYKLISYLGWSFFAGLAVMIFLWVFERETNKM